MRFFPAISSKVIQAAESLVGSNSMEPAAWHRTEPMRKKSGTRRLSRATRCLAAAAIVLIAGCADEAASTSGGWHDADYFGAFALP